MKELINIEILVTTGALCECYGSDTQIKNVKNLSKVGLFDKIMSIVLCYPVKIPAAFNAHDRNDFNVSDYYECRRKCCVNLHKHEQYKYYEELYNC